MKEVTLDEAIADLREFSKESGSTEFVGLCERFAGWLSELRESRIILEEVSEAFGKSRGILGRRQSCAIEAAIEFLKRGGRHE